MSRLVPVAQDFYDHLFDTLGRLAHSPEAAAHAGLAVEAVRLTLVDMRQVRENWQSGTVATSLQAAVLLSIKQPLLCYDADR